MKVGIVSDVHNNVDALGYALDHLSQCELLLHLGDLVSDYRVDPAIIRLAEQANLLGIVGNHEKTVLMHPGSRLRERLAPEDLAYLQGLPAERLLTLEGLTVRVNHGAPWDDPRSYRCTYVERQDVARDERLAGCGAAILLLGHTHQPMIEQAGPTLVMNPGSCGEARAGGTLTYGLLDLSARCATVFGIALDGEPSVILERSIPIGGH